MYTAEERAPSTTPFPRHQDGWGLTWHSHDAAHRLFSKPSSAFNPRQPSCRPAPGLQPAMHLHSQGGQTLEPQTRRVVSSTREPPGPLQKEVSPDASRNAWGGEGWPRASLPAWDLHSPGGCEAAGHSTGRGSLSPITKTARRSQGYYTRTPTQEQTQDSQPSSHPRKGAPLPQTPLGHPASPADTLSGEMCKPDEGSLGQKHCGFPDPTPDPLRWKHGGRSPREQSAWAHSGAHHSLGPPCRPFRSRSMSGWDPSVPDPGRPCPQLPGLSPSPGHPAAGRALLPQGKSPRSSRRTLPLSVVDCRMQDRGSPPPSPLQELPANISL